MSFPRTHPLWRQLAAIDAEPTGRFRQLVEAAELDPKRDFRRADLTGLWLEDADLSSFDLSGAVLRDTGLRFAARTDGLILDGALLDTADRRWWKRRQKRISASADRPPDGCSERAAAALILRGEAPPSSWVPWIRSLNFDFKRGLSDLTPLAGLSSLSQLSLNGTSVRDLAPLAGLTRLSRLSLDGTAVRDFRVLSELPSLKYVLAATETDRDTLLRLIPAGVVVGLADRAPP